MAVEKIGHQSNPHQFTCAQPAALEEESHVRNWTSERLSRRVDCPIRLYATALSSNEVVALDRLPGPVQPPVFVGGGGTLAGGQFQFWLLTQAGQSYQIQASSNLVNWVTITNVMGTGGPVPAVDAGAGTHAMRFYRAVALDSP